MLIIAEIGFNFNNDIKLAKKMIKAAKQCGADAVKFQSFRADTLVLKSQPAYDIIKNNELSEKNHLILKEYSDKLNIKFFSTPFDIELLDFLIKKCKVDIIKIASGDLLYKELIERAAKYKKHIILSTGMSDLKEIDKPVKWIKKYHNKFSLLHCISEYPLNPKNANLNFIKTLKKRYKCTVGFSDHSNDIFLPSLAVALGAQIIEKHFTIDKNLPDADNAISMEPDEFKKMVDLIKKTIIYLGNEKRILTEEEKQIKTIARRSIYAKEEIKKGELITKEKIKIVRPYNPKSKPENKEKILNKKAKKYYKKNQAIII